MQENYRTLNNPQCVPGARWWGVTAIAVAAMWLGALPANAQDRFLRRGRDQFEPLVDDPRTMIRLRSWRMIRLPQG